jgi:ABC-type Fe3+ transport system substrate-binding protein
VLSGETPLATFGQRERTLYYKNHHGAPMAPVDTVEPVLLYIYVFAVPKGARNRNAATLVAAAMMSKEGQDLHQKYRNSASMFRPGTASGEFAKTHKIVMPDLQFIMSDEYAEFNKQVNSMLTKR